MPSLNLCQFFDGHGRFLPFPLLARSAELPQLRAVIGSSSCAPSLRGSARRDQANLIYCAGCIAPLCAATAVLRTQDTIFPHYIEIRILHGSDEMASKVENGTFCHMSVVACFFQCLHSKAYERAYDCFSKILDESIFIPFTNILFAAENRVLNTTKKSLH